MTAILYLLMIFVWGFSWIAIKWQEGSVPTEISIFYRFVSAAILMFLIGIVFKKFQKTKPDNHVFFALQGVCLFCCNFLAFYGATHYIASGLTAVVMATAPIFNAVHGRLIYGTQVKPNFWFGVVVGLSGICLLFGVDLIQAELSKDLLYGLMLSLMGTWCFSMGNMISIYNSRKQIQPFTATSYAMVYGCIALFIIITLKGLSFEIDMSPKYLMSLVYLAVPASVIGFTVYLILVDRLGANQASYLMLITPIVALMVSSIFEDYQWSLFSGLGLVLVISGNLITQLKPVALSAHCRAVVNRYNRWRCRTA
ncbi:DMT(drug/metabolite transporter) superfamily permease [Shewanella psychrophila]|uniref:DMT(Drug/metabolite transporter) superfamily permease n=1 Tax=Shewanella psychrophila TaxID=225848 RepID=A0A1S6HLU3_9GAMM|nr:EamA family transporter [Shewanella psychrophila]AQS36483.1 DMT(drug/metabolite transporter) superfamily permease [Shewanella psychrophila]